MIIEGILKALLLGLATGLGAAFISGTVTWFTIETGSGNVGLSLGINLGVLFAVMLISAPVYYFLVFRPDEKDIARRVDRLGLEERMITMVELKDEQSYIAELQREDAVCEMKKVPPKQLKLRFPRKLLIALAIAFVCGAAMTTVSGLSAAGYIYSGYEAMDAIIPEEPPVYVSVTYEAIDGGMVEGEFSQVIVLGQSTVEVLAVAEDGYEFVMWSDGNKDPARSDHDVQGDLVYYALFQYLGESNNAPGDPTDEDEEQQQPDNSQSDQDQSNNDEDAPPQHTPTHYSQNSMILNGNTPYKPQVPQYIEDAGKDMQDSTAEDKKADDIINLYYTLIGSSNPEEEEQG